MDRLSFSNDTLKMIREAEYRQIQLTFEVTREHIRNRIRGDGADPILKAIKTRGFHRVDVGISRVKIDIYGETYLLDMPPEMAIWNEKSMQKIEGKPFEFTVNFTKGSITYCSLCDCEQGKGW